MISDDRVRDLRLQMAQIRAAGRENAENIVDSARRSTDWRYYVKQYPWATIGAAVAVGYLLIPRGAPRLIIDRKSAEEFMRHGVAGAEKSELSKMQWIASLALPFILRTVASGAWQFLEKSVLTKPAKSPSATDHFATPQRPAQPR